MRVCSCGALDLNRRGLCRAAARVAECYFDAVFGDFAWYRRWSGCHSEQRLVDEWGRALRPAHALAASPRRVKR